MRTKAEIAAKLDEIKQLAYLSAEAVSWLHSAAAALRNLDTQPDADNSVFHVAFDTQAMPGNLVATTVRLGVEVVGEHLSKVKKFNVALCNHPSYQNLRQYVLANPEACVDVPAALRSGES